MDISTILDWKVKLLGTAALLILNMLCGCIPLSFRRNDGLKSPRRDMFISLANSFAGGVFFSTVMLELLPEVEENMEEALNYVKMETEFPLGHFLIAVGFLFMLVLEHLIHSCCQGAFVNHTEPDDHDMGDERKEERKSFLDSNNEYSPVRNDDLELEDMQEETTRPIDANEVYCTQKPHRRNASFRAYMLVFAISLHSIFEGLAVGLIAKPSQLFHVYIALLIHKSIVAFSIGVQLVDARLKKIVSLVCVGIFSVMTPIGVALALLVLGSFGTGVKLFMSGILQALATGTFLYVTFFEVLPHELSADDGNKALKILFVAVGCALVTGVSTYESGFHEMIRPTNETRNNATLHNDFALLLE